METIENKPEIINKIYSYLEPLISREKLLLSPNTEIEDAIKQFQKSIQTFFEIPTSNILYENATQLSYMVLTDCLLYSYSILLHKQSEPKSLFQICKDYNMDCKAKYNIIARAKSNVPSSTKYLSSLTSSKKEEETSNKDHSKYIFFDFKLLLSILDTANPYLSKKININTYNTFFAELYNNSPLKENEDNPSLSIVSRYIIENMFQTNIFYKTVTSLNEIDNSLYYSNIIDDIIYNFHSLTALKCPEISDWILNYFEYSDVINSAKDFADSVQKNYQLKAVSYQKLYKRVKNSNSFFKGSLESYIDTVTHELDSLLAKVITSAEPNTSAYKKLHNLMKERSYWELYNSDEFKNLSFPDFSNSTDKSIIPPDEIVSAKIQTYEANKQHFKFNKLCFKEKVLNLEDACCSITKKINYDLGTNLEFCTFAEILTIARTAFHNYICNVDDNLDKLGQYINTHLELFNYYSEKINTNYYTNILNSNEDITSKCYQIFYREYHTSFTDALANNIDRLIQSVDDGVYSLIYQQLSNLISNHTTKL